MGNMSNVSPTQGQSDVFLTPEEEEFNGMTYSLCVAD